MTTPHRNPYVLVCPYLQLRKPTVFGDWWLGPVDDYTGSWYSEELRLACHSFLGWFVDHNQKPIAQPTLLVSSTAGVDGTLPDPRVLSAVESTIQFLVLDTNPHWSEETQFDTWRIATTDNAELWAQPLDLASRRVAFERGGRVRTTLTGYKLADKAIRVPPPLELHLPTPPTLDEELAEALYLTLTAPPAHAGVWPVRIGVAARWLARSWLNSPSLSDLDRIVQLKTALEGLTGTSETRKAQRRLAELFETTAHQPGAGVGVDDLLWSPTEPTYKRTNPKTGEPEPVSALGDWLYGLAKIRNAIIHDGANPELVYHRADSPYNGPLIEVGTRVLREAIKVALGECGFRAVWRHGMARASYHAQRRLETTDPEP